MINFLKRLFCSKSAVSSEQFVFNEQPAASSAGETPATETASKQGDFEKLLSEMAQVAKSYDQLAAQLGGDSRELLLDVVQKTIDSMLLSGCQPITDEPLYDMSRHRPEPFSLAAPGTPVKRTVRPGVEWQGKVYIPAVVEL